MEKAQKAPAMKSSTKKQLFSAVAMLLVAAVSLGTATYAWFQNNAVAEVEDIKLEAVAATGLEIALMKQNSAGAGANWNFARDLIAPTSNAAAEWKSIIPNADVVALHNLPASSPDLFGVLKPASTVKAHLPNAINGTNAFYVDNSESWSPDASGSAMVASFAAVQSYRAKSDTVNGASGTSVFLMPLYLRSTDVMDVYWNIKDSIWLASPGSVGTPNEILKALRIGFVSYDLAGNVSKSAIFHLDDNGLVSGNRQTSHGQPGPNFAISSAALLDGTPTYGNSDSLTTVQGRANWGVIDANGNGLVDPTELTGSETPIYQLDGDRQGQKLLVYIWLEGCDYDTLNILSGQDWYTRLSFIGRPL